MITLIHIHQVARRHRKLRCEASTFAVYWVFDHLNQDFLPLVEQRSNIRSARFLVAATITPVKIQIINMQKGGSLYPNINKGSLHTRQYSNHLALVNIAHQPSLLVALD